MKKRLTACITALLLCIGCLTMTSCKEDDGKGYVFGYDISSNPGSLDPQYASDKESYLIIGCIFEGLYRTAGDGSVEKAMAESLYMHRNTINYRLNKIKELTEVLESYFKER